MGLTSGMSGRERRGKESGQSDDQYKSCRRLCLEHGAGHSSPPAVRIGLNRTASHSTAPLPSRPNRACLVQPVTITGEGFQSDGWRLRFFLHFHGIGRCPQAAVQVSSEDDDEEAEAEDGGNGDRRLPVALAWLDAGRRLSRVAPAGNLAIHRTSLRTSCERS
jgi:hypothetical protein